ncbi:hypothetical protein FNV43_RR25861 [Rhamnella rubrinervis]|uniref:Uncharacterized protein n=1 Tax=Rhamnella rubrinervis TaxID=2594499 RepID=A0A8K0DLV5_9ROSA|nr:hypothetical protein FNV43_RR25861 [Rhamnella rubrinervis]
MPENRDTVEGGDRPLTSSGRYSDPPDSPEDSNGFVHVESPAFTTENDVGGSSFNQELGSSPQMLMVGAEEGKVTEDAGKDEFVDCPDELVANADGKEAAAVATEMGENSEDKLHSQGPNESPGAYAADEVERLRAMLDKTVSEKESVSREYQEEREAVAREVANLRHQLKALTNHQLLHGESGGELVDRFDKAESGDSDHAQLSVLMNECSWMVKSAYEERLQTDATIRELRSVLVMKDQEIEDFNRKVTEFSVLGKSVEVSLEVQREKDMHLEMVTNKVLASLAGMVDQQEMLDDSLGGKLDYVEKGTSILVEKFNEMLSEVDQLRECLSEARVNIGSEVEFGTVFAAAREELLELRRKELEFLKK